MIRVVQVLKERRFKAGYIIRQELWENSVDEPPTLMRAAYNYQGDYIGSPREAYRLCIKLGIKPEKAQESHVVCSIGFSAREQKWYGWSHRAIFGFTIASSVKMGDLGFVPSNRGEFIEYCRLFWDDSPRMKHTIIESDEGLVVTSTKPDHISHLEPWPSQWGRGAWTAETLDDAKQMAIAFAEGVS